MTWQTINLNNRVRVKLREPGQELVNAQRETLKAVARYLDWSEHLKADPEGWVEMPLWEVAQLFGPCMRMGCDSPIETTIHVLCEPKIPEIIELEVTP